MNLGTLINKKTTTHFVLSLVQSHFRLRESSGTVYKERQVSREDGRAGLAPRPKFLCYHFAALLLALIVYAHLYCARNSCRNVTPRHALSALAEETF